MRFGQVIRELLVGRLAEDSVLPQVWSQVGVGLGDGGIGSLGEVSKGTSRPTSRGVAILNSGHLKQLLGDGSRDNAGSTGCRNESHPNGATLSGDLAGHGVGLADLVTPESPPNWQDGQLGEDDGSTDSSGHLLGALDSQTNVSVVVTNGHEGLEPGPLTGTGLLLDGHDLQNLILKLGAKERVDNLGLFDREREEIDLFQGPDLLVLDETSQFGDGNPLALFLAAPATTSTTAASASTVAKSTTETSTIGWC